MAEDKSTLVLHLVSGGESLLFPLPADDVERLRHRIPLWLEHGSTEQVETAEGLLLSINFGQVAVAYIDNSQRTGKVFGLH